EVESTNGMATLSQSDRFKKKYPEWHRDTGAKVLDLIVDRRPLPKLRLDTAFGFDSLFCEWAYVIDCDNDRLEVYAGFNKTPTPDDSRWTSSKMPYKKYEYHPVRLLKTYDFDKLPATEEEF